jgi:hypothetical protein
MARRRSERTVGAAVLEEFHQGADCGDEVLFA